MEGITFDKQILNLDKSQGKRTVLVNRISEEQPVRTRQDIATWRAAIRSAENIHFHNRKSLYELYREIELDAHVKSVVFGRKNKTLSKPYCFVDTDGEEIEETSELFNAVWFKEFLSLALDSRFWGFSLIQLGDIKDDKFTSVKLVPRPHVKPEFGIVVAHTGDNKGFSYLKPPFKNWTVPVGNPEDLGIYLQVAPNYIYKKDATGNWADYTHMFGMPIRIGRTDTTDPISRQNMEAQLRDMGSKAYMVLGDDDGVEFAETSKDSTNELYERFCNWLNAEISKVVIGQTGTSDTKGILKGEVAERTADDFAKADAEFIDDVVNESLIPKMRELGISIPEGKWRFKEETKLTQQDKINQIDILARHFKIDPEYIQKEFGVVLLEDQGEEPPTTDPEKKKNDPINALFEAEKLYSHSCCEVLNLEQETEDPDLFTEEEISAILLGIYSGLYTVDNIPVEFARIETFLNEGVEIGLSAIDLPDGQFSELRGQLRNNINVFSAAQNKAQIRELSSLVIGADGVPKTFSAFRAEAVKVFKKFNVNHLRTEFNLSIAQSQAAALWESMQADIEMLPYATFRTVGDDRVRPFHQSLNGVTKRLDDEFWRTYWPPIDWACRCTVTSHAIGTITPNSEITFPSVPAPLLGNAGITKSIFNDSHPYFV